MIRTIVSVCAILAVAAVATAAVDGFPVVNPGQHWKPKDALPPGANGAVVRGDPATVPYAYFARFPARFAVPSAALMRNASAWEGSSAGRIPSVRERSSKASSASRSVAE